MIAYQEKQRRTKKMEEVEERLDVLDLSGRSLESVPSISVNLAAICKLDLSNNILPKMSESLIARLLNLVVLDVRSNQLRALPNSIGCLSKLKILNVSGNLLVSLPKTIENCKSLEELTANFNKIVKLPENIGLELHHLKKISVNSNKIEFLPMSITHLTSLKILDIRLNNLRQLPDDMENLINLEVLNVSQNFQYLESLPYSIGLLLSLVELDVSYNKIRSLPDSIGCLRKLEKLSVEGNPLVSPPPDVVAHGLHAVKEYMSELMNAPPCKRGSWVSRLKRYATIGSGAFRHKSSNERRDYVASHYRPVDGLATPKFFRMLSPKKLFPSRWYSDSI